MIADLNAPREYSQHDLKLRVKRARVDDPADISARVAKAPKHEPRE